MTLAHPYLYLRQQQQDAAGRYQHHHHLQRPADLAQYLADLPQDRTDIQQANGGKFTVELGDHLRLAIRAETGQPALRLPVQRARRENKEEVRAQALPVHMPQAGHFCREILGVASKGQRVTEPHIQPLRQFFFHRHFAYFGRPASGGDRVMVRTMILPG